MGFRSQPTPCSAKLLPGSPRRKPTASRFFRYDPPWVGRLLRLDSHDPTVYCYVHRVEKRHTAS